MSDAMRDAHPNSVRATVLSNMEDFYPIWRQFVSGAARMAADRAVRSDQYVPLFVEPKSSAS